MKQKIVVNVKNCEKCRSKALQIAVSLPGVESASLKVDGKSQIEVTGEGVDPVQLTCLLRKKIGCAKLVTVSEVAPPSTSKPNPDPKPPEDGAKPAVCQPCIPTCYVCKVPYYPCYCSVLPYYPEPCYCPIL